MLSPSKQLSTFFMLITLFVTSIEAKELSPYQVLETTGQKLFSRIANSQKQLQESPDLMLKIIEEELMPVIDYKYSAYRILGKHLSKISKKQRKEFANAMRKNLIKTYSSALRKYKNQQVIFEKEKPTHGKKIVAVKAQIIELNKPTINIVFKMRQNKKTKEWRTFDMVVEGISLLSTKQAEIGHRISKLGVDNVTSELAAL